MGSVTAMTAIPLRSLTGDLDPVECKLHCAVFNGSDHPIDVLTRVGSFGLVPWVFGLQCIENRLDLGVYGWRVGGDDAVEVDGGRAQGFEGAQEAAQ